MLIDLLKRNGGNIVKTGVFVLISTLAHQLAREQVNETLRTAAQSIRKVKHEIQERKLLQGES